MSTDTVEFTDAGLLKVQVDEQTFTLRRPKIGELRAFDEAWTAIGNAQTARQEMLAGLDPEARKDTPPHDFADEFIAWYRQVFEVLSDTPLPEADDDLPGWFVGAEAGNEMRPKWKSVPWVAGAKPSEQTAAATFNQLAQMTQILTRLERAIPSLTSANGTHS